jgi:hypothetical protein
VNFTIDVRPLMAVADTMGNLPARLGRTVATALTRTAVQVAEAERREIDDVFDRPVEFTRQAIYVSPAQGGSTRTRVTQDARGQNVVVNMGPNLQPVQAEVGVKNEAGRGRPAIKWLQYHIEGGRRRLKGYELLLKTAGHLPEGMVTVPGRFAKIDSYGNMSRGQILQVLSQLRIDSYQGSTRSLQKLASAYKGRGVKSLKTRLLSQQRRAGGEFVVFPNGRGRLRPGIYRMRNTAWGRTDPQPILMFVSKAQYEAERFDFFYVAQKAIGRHLPQEAGRAMLETLAHMQGFSTKNAKVTYS